jgi:hypothetical protein
MHPILLCFVIGAINTKHVLKLVIITMCGKRIHQMCIWSVCTRNVESSNKAPSVVATPNYVELINMDLLVPNALFNKRHISKIRCRLFFLLSNERIGTFTLNKLIICKSVEVKFRFKLEYQVYSKVHHFDVWNTKNLNKKTCYLCAIQLTLILS